MQNQQTNSSKRNSNTSKTASNLGAAAYKGSERTEARGESEDTGVETGSPRSSRSEGEQKSIGTVIAQGLTKDTQESIDRVMDQAGEYYEAGRSYIRENPREAALLGVSIGMAAWALLFTKPGRRLFDRGAEMALPEVSRWFSSNFSGRQSQQSSSSPQSSRSQAV